MPNLNCSVHNCSYNRDNNCSLAAIHVGGQEATRPQLTCCENFISTEYTNSNEVHQPYPQVDIECKAVDCIYNYEKRCAAKEVQIGGKEACSTQDTDCVTFCSR